MKLKTFVLLVILTCSLFPQTTPQYNWMISYPVYNTEGGRLLASGDTTVIMRAEFIDVNTATNNQLLFFAIRPFTSHSTTWYFRSFQLWLNTDSDPSTLNTSTDSLIDTKLSTSFPAVQQSPTNRMSFSLPGGSINLGTNSVFFVAAEVEDFRTDDIYDDVEITDQNNVTLGMTVNKTDQDLVVNPPEQSNNWGGDETKLFRIKAVNLPIVVKNPDPSSEESDTHYPRENMFFPNFTAMDGSAASKQERLQNQSFQVSIMLDTLLLNDSLSYASMWIGWDNDILELDTMVHGDLWAGKWDPISQLSGHYDMISGTGDSARFLLVRFESWVTTTEDTPYVPVNNNSIADLTFHVRKPGISPIFIQDEQLLDRWGIKFHTYRKLQNNATGDPYTGGTKYDGWAKFILGDYTGPESSGDPGSGIGDAKVQFEDISLFSNYLFISSSDTGWYNRFDIGAEGFHDPDGIVQYDDTTNFYDLLIFGANYFRSSKGNFLQKSVQAMEKETIINVHSQDFNHDQYRVDLSVKDAQNLLAAHLKLRYDPGQLKYLRTEISREILESNPDFSLLTPPAKKMMNSVDINFFAGSKAINGDLPFVSIIFTKKSSSKPQVTLEFVDLRDVNGAKQKFNVLNTIIPQDYELLSCYPNPFNPDAVIKFEIRETGNYSLKVYDILGNEVNTLLRDSFSPGNYKISWDGLDHNGNVCPSGVYFIRLTGGSVDEVRKITMLK